MAWRDLTVAGPLNRDDMTAYINAHYPLTGTMTEILINRSMTARNGLGKLVLDNGDQLYVTHLQFTMPGNYILECEHGYPVNPCNCEHVSHFPDTPKYDPSQHPYIKATAGTRSAIYVGKICDVCADGHYHDVLTEGDPQQ